MWRVTIRKDCIFCFDTRQGVERAGPMSAVEDACSVVVDRRLCILRVGHVLGHGDYRAWRIRDGLLEAVKQVSFFGDLV
ncbi:hypothetical protein [uncultured Tateyamaria sp.]|uniref:hypothetical protein n=1 Tax=uncultured Tateyamaria sp. TaxID=455651 RepID=UPI002623018E|nr:hypothetical protein [uncultured Tateyamaria sp.]